MCGIAGFIEVGRPEPERVCDAMARAIVHRGPDDAGVWAEPRHGVALGHRRLSILDLSPAGHQPMTSASGRFVMVFNGEIYNHLEIRRSLEAAGSECAWRGRSDTETLLAAIEAWGVAAALRKCVGMFAFALWDARHGRLILARDRLGEKPLYYGAQGNAFLFGSELKALRAHPAFRAEIDRGSIALYLRHNYVPDPRSIYVGIRKLLPGTYLEVHEGGRFGDPEPYWRASEVIAAQRASPFSGTDADAIEHVDRILGDAIAGQMVADVPLGAFLSGGIDSSLVVALMQRRSGQPVRTFTIGFADEAYNEARFARAVAAHLGTDHTELILEPSEAMAVIADLPAIYDEPFGDSSQIPTALVARLARQHVTVSLSGDAGDELFCGYTRYVLADRIVRSLEWMPAFARRLGARMLRARSAEQWDESWHRVSRVIPRRWRLPLFGTRLHKFADILSADSHSEIYRNLVSHWSNPSDVCLGVEEPQSLLRAIMASGSFASFEESMMYWDLMTYLPGDILVKVDRAAMAVSLETRVPMLDHRVVEFAWSLPLRLRIRRGQGKWLLRQVLYRYVPQALVDRPKMGFGVPIDAWLRGALRGWAEALLDPERLRREGVFDVGIVRERWQQHLAGRGNWSYPLWDVLMFQAWRETL